MNFPNNLVDLQIFGFDVHEFNSPQTIVRFGNSTNVEGEEHVVKK
jgi:hypothetical protein